MVQILFGKWNGMARKIVSVWFPNIATDLIARRYPMWRDKPLALFSDNSSRLVVTAVNPVAKIEGVRIGMTLADAQAVVTTLDTIPHQLDKQKLGLEALARLMERVTPMAAIVGDDTLFLDMTGGTHLFGGEHAFLEKLNNWLTKLGFSIRLALANTPGAAWAIAHYGATGTIAQQNELNSVLATLPIAALRLPAETVTKLKRLGINCIQDLINLPRQALVRRFGIQVATRIDQALGAVNEPISPKTPKMAKTPKWPKHEITNMTHVRKHMCACQTTSPKTPLCLHREITGVLHVHFAGVSQNTTFAETPKSPKSPKWANHQNGKITKTTKTVCCCNNAGVPKRH